MIKKFGVILIVLLYTVTASGFALNLHYCGNRVAAIKINAPAKGCESKPVAKAKMKCCKDAKLDVKVKDSHKSSETSAFSKVFSFEIFRFNLDDFFLSAQQALIEKFTDSSPPDKPTSEVPVFIKNRVLKI